MARRHLSLSGTGRRRRLSWVLPAAELGGSPSDYSIDELASIYPDLFFQTAEAATAVCELQPGYTGAGAGRVRQLPHAQP